MPTIPAVGLGERRALARAQGPDARHRSSSGSPRSAVTVPLVGGARRLVASTYRIEAADLVARAAGIAARPGVTRATGSSSRHPTATACSSRRLAVARAGGVAVPVNPQDGRRRDRARRRPTPTRSTRIDDFDELSRGRRRPTRRRPSTLVEVAVLFYTSGTTGKPKGAQLSHRALVGTCGCRRAGCPRGSSQRGCGERHAGRPRRRLHDARADGVAGRAASTCCRGSGPTDALDAIEQRRADDVRRRARRCTA